MTKFESQITSLQKLRYCFCWIAFYCWNLPTVRSKASIETLKTIVWKGLEERLKGRSKEQRINFWKWLHELMLVTERLVQKRQIIESLFLQNCWVTLRLGASCAEGIKIEHLDEKDHPKIYNRPHQSEVQRLFSHLGQFTYGGRRQSRHYQKKIERPWNNIRFWRLLPSMLYTSVQHLVHSDCLWRYWWPITSSHCFCNDSELCWTVIYNCLL